MGGKDLVRLADQANHTTYWVAWAGIIVTIFFVQVIIDPMRFADSTAYEELIAYTYHFPPSDWLTFEPLSRGFFYVLMEFTRDPEYSVFLGHLYISIIFILSALAIFPPSQGNWRGLLMTFAIFGSQLAFVTIRATPAYILAALAILEASRGRKRAYLLLILACLFHISAVLAVVPFFAVVFRDRFQFIEKLQNPRAIATVLVLTVIFFLLFGFYFYDITYAIIDSIPFLSKYTVFLVGLSDEGGVAGLSEVAIGHYVLFVGITAFLSAYILVPDPITRSTLIMVVSGYLVYSFIFFAFSPIAAFRQGPFWLIPAFTLFPWHKIGWKGSGQVLFLLLVAGMFGFQFDRVLF